MRLKTVIFNVKRHIEEGGGQKRAKKVSLINWTIVRFGKAFKCKMSYPVIDNSY